MNSDSFLTFIYDESPVSPIIFYGLNNIFFGVTPIDPVIIQIIYGKAIWPAKVLRNQNTAMLPIHPGRLNFRLFSLVSPEHKPVTEHSLVEASHLSTGAQEMSPTVQSTLFLSATVSTKMSLYFQRMLHIRHKI